MKRTAAALMMCAVMVLVCAVPLAMADTHDLTKGLKGPNASAVTWSYTPPDYGQWTGKVDNNGLRWLVLTVYDNSTGVPTEIARQHIRFAAYGAYPTGTVVSDPVEMGRGHVYDIKATPNGPRGTTAIVTDQFTVDLPPMADFKWSATDLVVSFDASASMDPDGTIDSYVWDFGDGMAGSGEMVTHNYAAGGIYPVKLTVTDNVGLTDAATQEVTVSHANQKPVAAFTAVLTNYPDVAADASASTDPDGTIVSFDWTWGDGTTSTTTSAKTTHSYAAEGLYTITLIVTDDGGLASDPVSHDVNVVPPTPPVALFTPTVSDLTVDVNAQASYDPDGTIIGYDWMWGDGTTGTGDITSHTYPLIDLLPHVYTITLTVTDNQFMTGSVSHDVTVQHVDLPPVAVITIVDINFLEASFSGAASSDPDGTIESYAWTFGDGGTSTVVAPIHTYTDAGIYPVKLTVTDDMGLKNTASTEVTVGPAVPPVAQFTYTTSKLTVSVDGSTSFDPDGTIMGYSWNWGDGTTLGTGDKTTHTYAVKGTYTVTLTVTDDDLLTASTAHSVTVEDVVPIASFIVTKNYLQVSVDASASSDPDGTITTYAWNWGDTKTGIGKLATHTYAAAGTYPITLTVTDDGGMIGTSTQSVTVVAPIPPIASFVVLITDLKVDVDGTASSDPDDAIVTWAWNWGDGSPDGSGAVTSHTYAAAGTYKITLTVTDASGLTGTVSHDATVKLLPKISYKIDSFFESYLKNKDYAFQGNRTATEGLNSWWPMRVTKYSELIVRNTYPFVTGYGVYSAMTTPNTASVFGLQTFYRMNLDAKNVGTIGTSASKDPVFLPILNPAAPGGGTVSIKWRSDVMTGGTLANPGELYDLSKGLHFANTYYGAPKVMLSDDGYWNELFGTVTFDRQTAQRFLGLPGVGSLATEFSAANVGNAIGSLWLDDWMTETGAGGIYDIAACYDYPNDIRQVVLTLDPSSTADKLVVRLWSVSWGNDMMLVRYLDVTGINPSMEAYFEDMYFNATIGPEMGDVQTTYTSQYHMLSWADPVTLGTGWMIEASHIDYTGSSDPLPSWQSRYNPYDPEQTTWTRLSLLPGTTLYDQQVSYFTTPMHWNLKTGESLVIQLPTRVVGGFTPYTGTSDTLNAAKATELNSHWTSGNMVLGNCFPASLSSYYNAATKTLSIVGPTSFPANPNPANPLLNETGSPMFMFDVVPVGAASSSVVVAGSGAPVLVTASGVVAKDV